VGVAVLFPLHGEGSGNRKGRPEAAHTIPHEKLELTFFSK